MPLKVLFWGHAPWQPIPYYRGGQFREHLPHYGVEPGYVQFTDFPRAAAEDFRPLDWADVAVFRRWYQDPTTPAAWDYAGKNGKARVYDSDDWDLGTSAKIPHRALIAPHHGLIKRMLAEADVVTVATPVLAVKYRGATRREPLVVRNAVDRSLYLAEGGPTAPNRAVFYGTRARLNDYFGGPDSRGRWRGGYAHAAVVAAGLRPIWIGDEGVGETIPREFEQIVPFERDLRLFARTLTATGGLLGLAPLQGDAFDACKSELHWLDYSAAGLPVVAQHVYGGGPYDVVRDRQDGFLARGHEDWRQAVFRLARNPSLRAEVVAAAQARLDTEYNPARRAGEWAEAFRIALS